MVEQPVHLYDFGRFRLDPVERLLLRDGEPVPLTPKVFEILLVLVRNRGRIVEKTELMSIVWPDAFVEEGNLTQNISLLRKALGEGLNGQQYVETVSRRGYRFVAPVSEIPYSNRVLPLVGARVVVQPQGEPERNSAPIRPGEIVLRASTSVEATATPASSTAADSRRYVDIEPSEVTSPTPILLYLTKHRRGATVAGVFILFGIVAALYLIPRTKTAESNAGVIDSVAVLPFVSDSPDEDTDYFNDEITETLINNLAQLPKLRVVPRSVVVAYKGEPTDPRRVGRDLGVRAVLTGNVRRRGDMLSIQAELIDTETVSQIWGQHYERKLADALLVPEEISKNIFESLRLKLTAEEARRIEAQRLYIIGRNYWNKRTADGLQQGIDYFQKAIDTDPGFAPPYAGLADCYNMLVVYGVRKPNDAFPLAKQAAVKALEIDDSLAEAHTSLAFIAFRWTWDRLDAEKEFQLAIKAKPTYAPAHQWYSSYLVAVERYDEAIAEAQRSQQLEPLSFISDVHLAWILYLAGRYDDAIVECKRLLEIDQNFFPARRYLGLALEQKGLYSDAISEFQRGVQLSGSPLMVALLGHAYAISGKTKEARQIISELEQLPKQRYVSPYTIAAIYAGLGDKDHAFRELEEAYQQRDIWLMNLKVDPVLRSLKSDRRFADMLRRTGLAP
jgi:DNA-binding winged helix-turn-helix (wHTH) protein/TolB-like protein